MDQLSLEESANQEYIEDVFLDSSDCRVSFGDVETLTWSPQEVDTKFEDALNRVRYHSVSGSTCGQSPVNDELYDPGELVDHINKNHVPEHGRDPDSHVGVNGNSLSDVNDELQKGNVVQGHLVTLKSRDGHEKVFFLDPHGKLLPVLPAQFTPVCIKVRR